METLVNNDINFMTNFRITLHRQVYTNEELLIRFITYLSNSLAIINYELDMENKTIKLKIRKSIYKKKSTFNHEVLYYYPIINSAFVEFIKSISMYVDQSNGEYINNILSNNMSLLYNIMCIGDNIIIIQL